MLRQEWDVLRYHAWDGELARTWTMGSVTVVVLLGQA